MTARLLCVMFQYQQQRQCNNRVNIYLYAKKYIHDKTSHAHLEHRYWK